MRHIIVDTIGLLLKTVVHAVDIQDRDGAKLVLDETRGLFPRFKLLWADRRYSGKLVSSVKPFCQWALEIVKGSDNVQGFKVLPHRWVVEPTLAWSGRYPRFSKDYE